MSDKMREEFEAWFTKELVSGEMTKAYCWQAWQASRAALVVELPSAFDASMEDASYYEYAYLQDEVEKALDKAGVSYK